MKTISMYFPTDDNLTTLINEWFDGLNQSSDIIWFKIVSTTQVDGGVLIIVEIKYKEKGQRRM